MACIYVPAIDVVGVELIDKAHAQNTTTRLPHCPVNSSDNSSDMFEMVMEYHSMPHLLATSIVLGTIILSTIIGNVFVIAAIILERNLHNVANYLVASLAVADLMVAALVMPLAAVNEVSKQWFLGSEICDMWISFDVLCCTSSILHLVAIALDRYWAVTRIDYIHNRSAKRILLMIALSWAISACISIPPLFGWKDNEQDPDINGQCLISQDWGYTVYSTLGAFYMPLGLLIIIYVKIFRAARSRIRRKRFRAPRLRGAASNTPKPLLDNTASDIMMHQTNMTQIDVGTHATVTTATSSFSQSPEPSTNGSALAINDANRNNKMLGMSPPSSPGNLNKSPGHKTSWIDLTKMYLDGARKAGSPKAKKSREKIEQKRERKAARTLGVITGSFIVCWLPFFMVALIGPFCGTNCQMPHVMLSIIGWLGFFNSLLNPVIYTIFNPDFRLAFRKILFGKYHNRYRRGGARSGPRR